MMYSKTTFILASICLSTVSEATLVGNLFLIQPNALSGSAYNTICPDRPELSNISASVINIGGGGWKITDIQNAYNLSAAQFGFVTNTNSALLTVSKYIGTTPSTQHIAQQSTGSDIIVSTGVTGTWTLQGTSSDGSSAEYNFDVNTSAISQLQGILPGSYCVTLTPISNFSSMFGLVRQEWTQGATPDGWQRNPGGGQGLQSGTDWDSPFADSGSHTHYAPAIGISGTQVTPEPASILAIGFGLLAFMQRKKK